MYNQKPMLVLEKYLMIVTMLVKNASSREDSLETYVLQEALLDSLLEKIQLTKNDVNAKMLNELAQETPN